MKTFNEKCSDIVYLVAVVALNNMLLFTSEVKSQAATEDIYEFVEMKPGNVTYKYKIDIPASGRYSIDWQHQPSYPSPGNVHIVFPKEKPDKYQVKLSKLVTEEEGSLCRYGRTVGCYRCEEPTENDPCRVTIEILNLELKDSGSYSTTLKADDGKRTELPKLILGVYAYPAIDIKVNNETYNNGATVKMTEGNNYTIIANLSDVYPPLNPECSYKYGKQAHDVLSVTSNHTTKLKTMEIRLDITPNSTWDRAMNCTFKVAHSGRAEFDPIHLYLMADMGGTAAATSLNAKLIITMIAATFIVFNIYN